MILKDTPLKNACIPFVAFNTLIYHLYIFYLISYRESDRFDHELHRFQIAQQLRHIST
jgi:hypothetical protein